MLKKLEAISFQHLVVLDFLAEAETQRDQSLAATEAPDNATPEANSREAWLAEFLTAEEAFWRTRYAAHATSDLAERGKAVDTFSELIETVKAWLQIGNALAGDRLIESGDSPDDQLVLVSEPRH